MDRDMFKESITGILNRLPPAVLNDVGSLAKKIIGEHRNAIERALPLIIPDVSQLVQVVGFEKATGMLKMSEVEADVMEVLARFGIRELPDRKCICGQLESHHPIPGNPLHTFQV